MQKNQNQAQEKFFNPQLYDESFYSFLKTPHDRVKYAMACASRFLARLEKEAAININIGKEKPIHLSAGNTPDDIEAIRYLWTALIVLGKQYPERNINESSIEFYDGPYKKDFHFDNQFQSFFGIRRRGIFAADSLFEKVFKTHLTPEMLIISANAPLYDGISGELSIEEQDSQWLQRCDDGYILTANTGTIPATEIEGIEKQLILLIEILYEYKKTRGAKPANYNEGYLSWAGYSKAEKLQVIDKIFACLGLEKTLNLTDEDIAIFHQGELGLSIAAWEKSANLGIDKELAQKITPHLAKLKGSCAFTLGVLHEQNNWLQNALNYYKVSLTQSYPRAYELFRTRGEKGDADALWMLAMHYYHPKKETMEAVCLCTKAALLGHARAETSVRESKFIEAIKFLDLHKNEIVIKEEWPEENSEKNSLQLQSVAMHMALQYESSLKPAKGRAFQAYLVAAKEGNKNALNALERLGTQASPKKQYKLGELYASFFANPESATFWNARAKEAEQFSFPKIQP